MELTQIPNAILGAKAIKGYIHSFEGGIYLLSVELDFREHYVTDTKTGRAMRFPSLHIARQCAQRVGLTEIELHQASAYEEMIGLSA